MSKDVETTADRLGGKCVQTRPATPDEQAESLPTLGRDAILDAEDAVRKRVPVPEWRGAVYVKGLSGAERDSFEQACLKRRKGKEFDLRGLKALLVARTLVDEDGKRMFPDADVPRLNAKSGRALDRIFKVAQRICGLSDEDVDELAKNSDSDLSGSSGSS